MITDQELDEALTAADPASSTTPAPPTSFLANMRAHDRQGARSAEPASVIAAQQLADEAHQRRRWGSPRRRIMIGVASAGLAAAISVGLVLLPGTTPTAYAGYDETPRPISNAESEALIDQCVDLGDGLSTTPSTPVLAEARGPWSYIVLVSEDMVTTCLSPANHPERTILAGGGLTPETAGRPQSGVRLDGSIFTQAAPGEEPSPEAFGAAVGLAAADVTAVDVIFEDGRTVHTTLTAQGWWGAWWPGGLDAAGDGGPTTLRYQTTDGEQTEIPYGDRD